MIHAVALDPNGRAVLVRSAGSFATVVSQDSETDKGGKYTQVKLQSGEVRHILSSSCATIGRVSNMNWKDRSLGKAGRARNLGMRPSVRGVAMNAYAKFPSLRVELLLISLNGTCSSIVTTILTVVAEVNLRVTNILDLSTV